GVAAFRELLRALAAGVHRPDFHRAAAIADEHDRALQAGNVELSGRGRRTDNRGGLRDEDFRSLGDFGSLGGGRRDRRRVVAGLGVAGSAEPVAIGAEAGVGVNGEFFVAVRRPALLGRAIPGAAAQDTHLTRTRPVRVLGRAFRVVGFAVPIVA